MRAERLASRNGFIWPAFMVLFASCRLTAPVAVAQVSHFDTVFLSADWEVTVFAHPQPPSGGIASQDLGPAPGLFCQRIEHTLGGTPTPSEVLSVHINGQATYNPKTECPIAFVDYSERARTISTEAATLGGATGPALRQDGNLYVADSAPTRSDPNGALPSAFLPVQFAGLTANSFRLVVGPGQYDASDHPDFSRTGSRIQFGFARANSHSVSATSTRVTAIDDWSVFIGQDLPTVADYGGAPDGSLGMTTGYYGFVAVPPFPYVYVLGSISGPAFFPTIQTNSGPFAVMNDLYVAPLPGSLESDAVASPGGTDADVAFNLMPLADDADNDLADGGGAMVLIFALSSRPPALFFTLAARASGGPPGGFWNVGIDLNQNGDWGPGEWVCEDIQFDFGTNNFVLLQSPFFGWGPPGAQFGRLTFPVWARNMVTSEPVSTNTPLAGPVGAQYYHGAGPPCGFTHGEIEDYFIEWVPIGQWTNDPPDEPVFGPDIPREHLVGIRGPEIICVGQRAEYVISGPPLRKLTVTYLPNVATGGLAGPRFDLEPTEARLGGLETEALALEAELAATGDRLYVTARRATVPGTIVVHGEPVEGNVVGPGVPAGPNRTPTFGAALIHVEDAICITGIRIEGNQVWLEWTGLPGPYRVQRADSPGGSWVDVESTAVTTVSLPATGATGYFRILQHGE